MKQWLAVAGFASGICLACHAHLSWLLILAGLLVGIVLIALQYWRIGSPWLTFFWNMMVAGTILCTIHLARTEREEEEANAVVAWASRASDYTQQKLKESGMPAADLAVLNAMLLGRRADLGKQEVLRFRQAGAQHLLALSGLHLGIFIGIFSFLVLKRARFSRYRWQVLAAVLSLLWAYCLVAGMPQSLLRAMLMASFYYVAAFCDRKVEGSVLLANTLLVMLLIDPLALFDVGTQLSFAAVGSLVWLYPQLDSVFPYEAFPRNRKGVMLRRIWQMLMVSLSAWIGTFPLCAYYFHQFQPWQPLVSLFLIPATAVLLYLALFLLLLCLSNAWFLAVPFGKVVSWWITLENAMLDLAGKLPCSTMSCPAIRWEHVCLLYLLFLFVGVGIQASRKVQLYAFLSILFVLLLLLML